MNNVYGHDIYTLRHDMCYDNKIMMPPRTPPPGTLEEVITSNKTEVDKNRELHEQPLKKWCGRLRMRTRTTVDLFIIVIVGLVVSFVEFGVIPNTNQGFICKDPKISYPFTGDTVSVTTLLVTAYFGPILMIILVEFFRENSLKKLCVGTVWNYYKECLIGATLVLLITEVIKVIMGEPRPHFIDSCEPDANRNCTQGTFVADYECLNTRMSNFFKTDITRSFPSGHTSVSLFIALYCSYLVQMRIPTDSVSSLTKPFLIAVCLTWSLFCSLSRITDHRHHWWDVLGGAFLAICGALYTLTLLHKKEKKKIRSVPSRTSTTMTTMSEEKTKEVTSVFI